MQRVKVAIIGFGNVGKEVMEAVIESPDMEVAGIVEVPKKVESMKGKFHDFPVTSSVEELGRVDIAILAVDSRCVPQIAPHYLEMGINTIDAFDIHGDSIIKLREELTSVAKAHDAVAILSAGWDPGTNSVVRTIMQTIAPKGMTYTNYGPGMSMGHTVAAKAVEGVADAVSLTIPEGNGIHKRLVYVKIKPGYDFKKIEEAIKNDSYFKRDTTIVYNVDDIENLIDMGHGVHIERKGVSGRTHNQRMEFIMQVTNPAATAQVMVSAARASLKQKPGAYTLAEIPPIDYLYGKKEEIILKLL
ncbi:MAG: diaminopimelate dehydrogenase [Tepidanaerobacter acetatoxydans]|uniref:diaminopimelate dehydrogenase n=1 Tax=Tepidanaerobacter TaxID=499228 RepID=UPI000ABA0F97|nr:MULTISPECIES: diaminopimelate dehydrogenase [Tepidanaerobacter]NLU10855.1 diaminopimelate dehydrogenase [Tepidanaerobacter acetatoxydans]